MIAITISVLCLVAIIILAVIMYFIARKLGDRGMLQSVQRWGYGHIPLSVVIADLELFERAADVKGAIQWAIEFWNREVGIDLFVPFGSIGCGGVIGVARQQEMVLITSPNAYATTKLTLHDGIINGANIYVREDAITDQDSLRRAMAHELGHGLGLAHDELASSVMYDKALSSWPTVTEKDRALLRELYSK